MENTGQASEPAAVYEKRGHIGIVTFNRPEAMNAVNSELSDAVGIALETAAGDADVRVVVVTGKGRAFCAGADLKEVARGNSIYPTVDPAWGFAGLVRHWIDKPVIAAVNGFALGGGTEIVLAADLAVAVEGATLGLPEVKRGLFAAAGGVLRVQRQIPLKRALELALTGDALDAATALEWGLVNRVVPAGQLMEVTLDLAERIAANAPLSVQHTKRSIYRARGGSDWDSAWADLDPWAVNEDARDVVFASRDSKEGPRAFAEKRAPVWEGR